VGVAALVALLSRRRIDPSSQVVAAQPSARDTSCDESHVPAEAIWEELETLASRPLPAPRVRRRAARYARFGALICLAPAILLGGHEQDELRAAGALSLVPFVIYIFVLYRDYSERDGRIGLAHALLGAAAVLAAVGMPRLTDGNPYLTAAVTAPLLITAVVMGESARRRWHRTDTQTEADLRTILRRRAQARAAESRRQPR
jgi:hypothetical protein